MDMLPCPFCGCQDIAIRTRKTTIVECNGCGALFIKADKGVAIQRWNNRVFSATKSVSSDHSESMPPLLPGDL